MIKGVLGKMKEKEERIVAMSAFSKFRDKDLTVYEKKFLLLAQRGDVIAVRKLMENNNGNPRFDMNCTDPLGRTALVVAIENENMELIQVLLEFKVDAGDALLHAISEEYVEAVDILLQYEESLHQPGKPYSWEAIESNNATYTKDITPLILAAHRDNYEIIKLLLDRGASLPVPHDVRCACDECVVNSREDCLRHSRSRINAYRALSSPSLIVLSSKDPVMTAFELSSEVRRLSSIENEFKMEYMELREKLEQFSTDLLSHTRTSHELSVVLNYDPNSLPFDFHGKMQLERLKLAIKFDQKMFVAHSSVQQLLASVWYEGMPGFRRKGPLGQMAEIGKLGIMFPIYCTAYLLAPESNLGKKVKQPFVKFIAHSSCYSFFLLLLILASQRAESLAINFLGTDNLRSWMSEYERKERGKCPLVIESAIIIFILGFIWGEIKELWDSGIANYANDMWNILDVITNIFYITWIGLRVVAWYQVNKEIKLGYNPWHHRDVWHPYDPMLLSEGMFGAAIIFSILKMVHIFSINPHLGPLQISLGRMVFDIVKFFFIYTLVVFAFGVGMNQLLWYYAENDKKLCYSLPNDKPNPHHELSCEIWRRFANLFETSQSLFWASFGLVELYNFELTGIQSYTRFWAMLMFGSYSVINVVVLLNLLIAMMSNSYQIISERSDTEWKFARSKLWMKYFEEGDTLPPPFNIMPSTKILRRVLGCYVKPPSNSVKIKEGKTREAEYERVIRSLVRRYVTNKQRDLEAKAVTEDDVNEVKQDIATFRYELFELLKTNGMNCSNIHCEKDTGKKEREFERRLLKGFNIGLVQTVIGAVMSQDRTKKSGFDVLRRMTGKRAKAQKNWNAIVSAAKERHTQIGSSHPSLSGSLKDLRERVMSEKDIEEIQLNNRNFSRPALMSAIARKARSEAALQRQQVQLQKSDTVCTVEDMKFEEPQVGNKAVVVEAEQEQVEAVEEISVERVVTADISPTNEPEPAVLNEEEEEDVPKDCAPDVKEENAPDLPEVYAPDVPEEQAKPQLKRDSEEGEYNEAFQDDETSLIENVVKEPVPPKKELRVRIAVDEVEHDKPAEHTTPKSEIRPIRKGPWF